MTTFSISEPASQEVLLAQLISVLEGMTEVQQRFLSVLQREKRLVIEGDLETLFSCLAEKESVLNRLNRLEVERQALMAPLARILNQDPRRLTLRQLTARVEEPFAGRLSACHLRLKALSASILEINQINGLLVEKTLKQVSSLLGLLKHLSTAPPIYQATGLASESPFKGKVLGKG